MPGKDLVSQARQRYMHLSLCVCVPVGMNEWAIHAVRTYPI